MPKRFEIFVPKNLDKRQEKLKLIKEKELKELNKLVVKLSNTVSTFKCLKIDSEAEKFFISQFVDVQIKIDHDKYSNTIFFFDKDNNYLSEYNSKIKYFWISHKNVWSFLESNYDLNYYQVKDLSKYWKEEHFKLRTVIVMRANEICLDKVEEHFKLKQTVQN